MYRSLVLVDPASDISTEQLRDELRRFYAGKDRAPGRIDLSDHVVTLHWTGYALMAVRQTAPHVLTESQEIADEFAQHHVARDRIARCAARFELSGGRDSEMAWFNDYMFVGEALARLGIVYRFEPDTAQFLD
jgi:hypothetical protein